MIGVSGQEVLELLKAGSLGVFELTLADRPCSCQPARTCPQQTRRHQLVSPRQPANSPQHRQSRSLAQGFKGTKDYFFFDIGVVGVSELNLGHHASHHGCVLSDLDHHFLLHCVGRILHDRSVQSLSQSSEFILQLGSSRERSAHAPARELQTCPCPACQRPRRSADRYLFHSGFIGFIAN